MKNRQIAKLYTPTARERLRRIDRSGPIAVEDSFVMRIVKALDISFERLAEICEISYEDLLELVASKRTELSQFDVDPIWNRLHDYVLTRLGNTMAVKVELDAKMQKDRERRVAQRLKEQNH